MISMNGSAFPSSSVPPQPQFTGVYPAIVAAVGGDGTGSTTAASTAGTTAASASDGTGAAGTAGATSGSTAGGAGTGTDSSATLIQMYIPQVLGTALSNWAPPLNPVAGVIPNVGDSVFAMFQGGDPRYASYIQAITAQGLAAAIATATNTDSSAIQPVSDDDTGDAGDTGVPADAGHVHPASGGGGDDGGGDGGATVIAAYKTASTSRSSTTSATADPDLVLAGLTASTTYEIRGLFSYTSTSATPGLIWGIGSGTDDDATMTASAVYVVAGASATTINPLTYDDTTSAATSAGNIMSILMDGTLTTDAGGSFALYWAQNTSSGTATVMNAGSYLLVQQLSG